MVGGFGEGSPPEEEGLPPGEEGGEGDSGAAGEVEVRIVWQSVYLPGPVL